MASAIDRDTTRNLGMIMRSILPIHQETENHDMVSVVVTEIDLITN